MKKKPQARTIHYRAIAESLEAQNQAVLMLMQAVEGTLDLDGDKLSPVLRDGLKKRAADVAAAMWPQEDEE